MTSSMAWIALLAVLSIGGWLLTLHSIDFGRIRLLVPSLWVCVLGVTAIFAIIRRGASGTAS
ncbi:MAG: hypothetical protein JF885_06990 [Candidatus Dormibacteraeota bacterium]|nr:hypothetical protein [Candidatus Dormibacteraeota bacterium]